MPGTAHEILVSVLQDQPELLGALVERLLGRPLAPLVIADSTVRQVISAEVRPDLLLSGPDRRWVGVEVQTRVDPDKARRWPLFASIQNDRHGAGDLLVITHSPHVARWARSVASAAGPLGSRLSFAPVVLLLAGESNLQKILDESRPELAFFAAWAMHPRHGGAARAVVLRALELSKRLEPALQDAQVGAILKVLSERMLAFLQEVSMDPAKLPESPAFRKFREHFEARGEARGEVRALLVILKARGLVPSEQERSLISSCDDVAQLDEWITRAATAQSVADVLARRQTS